MTIINHQSTTTEVVTIVLISICVVFAGNIKILLLLFQDFVTRHEIVKNLVRGFCFSQVVMCTYFDAQICYKLCNNLVKR